MGDEGDFIDVRGTSFAQIARATITAFFSFTTGIDACLEKSEVDDGALKQEHAVGLNSERRRHGEVASRRLEHGGVVRIVNDGDDCTFPRLCWNEFRYWPRRPISLEASNFFLRPYEPVGKWANGSNGNLQDKPYRLAFFSPSPVCGGTSISNPSTYVVLHMVPLTSSNNLAFA